MNSFHSLFADERKQRRVKNTRRPDFIQKREKAPPSLRLDKVGVVNDDTDIALSSDLHVQKRPHAPARAAASVLFPSSRVQSSCIASSIYVSDEVSG